MAGVAKSVAVQGPGIEHWPHATLFWVLGRQHQMHTKCTSQNRASTFATAPTTGIEFHGHTPHEGIFPLPCGSVAEETLCTPGASPQGCKSTDSGGTWVHLLSVYFFSVYTRSTSVVLAGPSWSAIFGGALRHPFISKINKNHGERG